MNGSPSAIISVGLGTWGSVSLMVTLGYGITTGALTGTWSDVTIARIDRMTTIAQINRDISEVTIER